MIIDTFLFGWELDLLECRLREMDSFVDVFVLVESDKTFQGSDKELHFQNNLSRFSQWSNKIVYLNCSMPFTENPWVREYASREIIKSTLSKYPPEAIVLHGDVDEIVSKVTGHQLEETLGNHRIIALEQNLYSMAVDWLYPLDWQGTVIARNHTVQEMSMVDLRNQRISAPRVKSGWHFTWLGGPEMIQKKAQSFSHTEDHIQSYIHEMGERLYTEGYHVLGEKLIPVSVDDTYPNYIKERKCPEVWFRPRPQIA